MKNNVIRNISWIALLAVWSFLAGAYFHLGWVRNSSMNYLMSFIVGGIGVWIVFTGIGVLVYRFAKKNGNSDSAKPALFVVSFFTVAFLLIAWIKYDEVQRDKFIEYLEKDFVLHYKNKASLLEVEIKDIEWKLEDLYFSIHFNLKRHSQLDKLMLLKTADALFEDNTIISKLCLAEMEMDTEIGCPPPEGMEKIFKVKI